MSRRFFKNYLGRKFSRLTVIEFVPNLKCKTSLWRCKCDCGNQAVLSSGTLTSGHTKSCGCLNKEKLKIGKRHYKGGISKNPLYWTLSYMKQRCYNSKNNRYKYYKDKGVVVCSEWLNNVHNFIDWAVSHGWKEGLTIDRINNDGNYEPSNCQWLSKTDHSHKTNEEKKINAKPK